jgi:hypothetical protein
MLHAKAVTQLTPSNTKYSHLLRGVGVALRPPAAPLALSIPLRALSNSLVLAHLSMLLVSTAASSCGSCWAMLRRHVHSAAPSWATAAAVAAAAADGLPLPLPTVRKRLKNVRAGGCSALTAAASSCIHN